jgi:hypothetical protein
MSCEWLDLYTLSTEPLSLAASMPFNPTILPADVVPDETTAVPRLAFNVQDRVPSRKITMHFGLRLIFPSTTA